MVNQRYITLTFLVAALCLGLVARSACVEAMAIAGWPDPLLLNLVQTSLLIAGAVGIAGFFFLLRHQRSVSFVDEVVVEMRKMFWPGREETVNSTTVVIITTLIISGSLAFYDFVWAKVTAIFLFSS